MRKLIAAAGLGALLLFAGCSSGGAPSGVAPADGPASVSATPLPPGVSDTPNFHQKFVYDDGLDVEVTNIKKGRQTGTDYATFTVRLKNTGTQRFKLSGDSGNVYTEASYGPDGEPAENTNLDGDPISGTLLPGRAKSGSVTYLISKKYWNDVVLEVSIPDAESLENRDPVVFAGPIA